LDTWLRELVADVPGAAALGRRYIEQCPAEASAAWLERQLFGTELRAASAGNHDRFIRNRIGEGREADLRNGRLLVLRGWVLTQTEGRLLALLSLRTT
jgi:hypothetical protein